MIAFLCRAQADPNGADAAGGEKVKASAKAKNKSTPPPKKVDPKDNAKQDRSPLKPSEASPNPAPAKRARGKQADASSDQAKMVAELKEAGHACKL